MSWYLECLEPQWHCLPLSTLASIRFHFQVFLGSKAIKVKYFLWWYKPAYVTPLLKLSEVPHFFQRKSSPYNGSPGLTCTFCLSDLIPYSNRHLPASLLTAHLALAKRRLFTDYVCTGLCSSLSCTRMFFPDTWKANSRIFQSLPFTFPTISTLTLYLMKKTGIHSLHQLWPPYPANFCSVSKACITF